MGRGLHPPCLPLPGKWSQCSGAGGAVPGFPLPGLWLTSGAGGGSVRGPDSTGHPPCLRCPLRIPGPRKSPEGPPAKTASTLPGRTGVDQIKKAVANGPLSSPLIGKVSARLPGSSGGLGWSWLRPELTTMGPWVGAAELRTLLWGEQASLQARGARGSLHCLELAALAASCGLP